MKKYIIPAIKVKEIAYESQLCDDSMPISSDTIQSDTDIYARPHTSTSVWDDEEEDENSSNRYGNL